MNERDVQLFLEREITYKPGWKVFVLGTDEGLMVRIVTKLENSYNPGEMVELGINSFPSPNDLESRDRLLTWFRWRLGRIELHERDEWLKVNGEPPFDPHKGIRAAGEG